MANRNSKNNLNLFFLIRHNANQNSNKINKIIKNTFHKRNTCGKKNNHKTPDIEILQKFSIFIYFEFLFYFMVFAFDVVCSFLYFLLIYRIVVGDNHS